MHEYLARIKAQSRLHTSGIGVVLSETTQILI
jgi:hypothetical protein